LLFNEKLLPMNNDTHPGCHWAAGVTLGRGSRLGAWCSLQAWKVLLILLVSAPMAIADSSSVRDALSAASAGAFEPLIRAIASENDPGHAALLQAREAASRLDEPAALRALERFFKSRASDAELSKLAYEIHVDAAFAAGEYKSGSLAAARLRDLLIATGPSQKLSEVSQTYTVASYLGAVPAQKLLRLGTGKAFPTWRDKVGLTRSRVAINGIQQEVVFDTGANLSVITQSAAKKLGLRMLEGSASIRSATSNEVATHIGLADRFVIAGSVLSNVAFLVLDDAQLEMPVAGGYRIDAIVGFPVFRALGRIRFGQRDFIVETQKLRDRARPPNLRAIGSSLFVQTEINGISVPLHLDTGASRSGLSSRFAREQPEVLTGLERSTGQLAGAGGAMQIDQALWRTIEITVAGRILELPELIIQISDLQTAMSDYYGVLGNDVLKAFQSFTLDFKNMHFQLGPPLDGPP
jgi:predicted aspartyl protease